MSKIKGRESPTISIILFAFNEEKNLKRLFPSLKKQTYPRNKLEYIFVDDGSTDSSIKLAKDFGCKIIKVNTHDVELNKGIGMYAAKGDFIYWMDADMEVISNNFFELLINPLLDDKNIFASFTKEFAVETLKTKTDNLTLRYLSYHPLQQDQLYVYLSTQLEKTYIEKKQNYYLCKFTSGKIPAVGRIMYRRKLLLKTKIRKFKHFFDLDTVEMVVQEGFDLFAFVPKAKINHYHIKSFAHLIRKRPRNLRQDYLTHFKIKYYLWINPKSAKDTLRLVIWVIYANLFLPELYFSFFQMIKYKDWVFILRPFVSIAVTDVLLLEFIKNEKGRDFLLERMKNIFKIPNKLLV